MKNGTIRVTNPANGNVTVESNHDQNRSLDAGGEINGDDHADYDKAIRVRERLRPITIKLKPATTLMLAQQKVAETPTSLSPVSNPAEGNSSELFTLHLPDIANWELPLVDDLETTLNPVQQTNNCTLLPAACIATELEPETGAELPDQTEKPTKRQRTDNEVENLWYDSLLIKSPTSIAVTSPSTQGETESESLPGTPCARPIIPFDSPIAVVKQEVLGGGGGIRPSNGVVAGLFRSTVGDGPRGGYCELCQVRYPGAIFDHRITNQHKTNRAVAQPVCSECHHTFDSASEYWRHCVLVHEKAATIRIEVDEFEHLWRKDEVVREAGAAGQKAAVVESEPETEEGIDERFFVDARSESGDDDSVQEMFSDEELGNVSGDLSPGSPELACPSPDRSEDGMMYVPAHYCNLCSGYFEAVEHAVDSHCQTEAHVARMTARRVVSSSENEQDEANFDERFFVDVIRDDHPDLLSDDEDDDEQECGAASCSRNVYIEPALYCKLCANYFLNDVSHACQID